MTLIKQMIATVLAVSCVTAIALAEQGDTSKPLKVFILAGQSNMQGFSVVSAGKDGDLDYAAANEFKYLKDADGKWVEREDVWYFSNKFQGKKKNRYSPVKKGNLKPGDSRVARTVTAASGFHACRRFRGICPCGAAARGTRPTRPLLLLRNTDTFPNKSTQLAKRLPEEVSGPPRGSGPRRNAMFQTKTSRFFRPPD